MRAVCTKDDGLVVFFVASALGAQSLRVDFFWNSASASARVAGFAAADPEP
jgi:hypothetical protein